jgi:glycosyltransferase involved in cell wall biosynthesis
MRYVDDYMGRRELSALYRGADALVLPSRAEGWGLPVLEAMACGTPAMVPEFGAFLVYAGKPGVISLPASRIRLPVSRYFTTNTLGFEEYVDRVDFCEPSPTHLAAAMRDVASSSRAARKTHSESARRTAEQFDWDSSLKALLTALDQLTSSSPRAVGPTNAASA